MDHELAMAVRRPDHWLGRCACGAQVRAGSVTELHALVERHLRLVPAQRAPLPAQTFSG